MQENNKSGLATTGMVLGIIAIVGSWIPFLNIFSIILGILALIFGGIALLKRRSISKAVTGVVLGILSVIIAIFMLTAASTAIDEALQPTQTDSSSEESSDSEQASSDFDGNAMFNEVQNGMTKEQVREVAGVDPSNCIESQDETFGTIENCTYGNMFTDNVTVSVTYSQGEVSNKSRFTHDN